MREGQNLILRKSYESSVTVTYDTTFNPENNRTKFKQNEHGERSVFCKCGLPQHLLVPKGSENGVPFILFVMISNFTNDEVILNTIHLWSHFMSKQVRLRFHSC